MDEDAFIEKFCEKPFQISALSQPDNNYYDLLGLLHILLVKNHKKKFHFTGGDFYKNVRKVAKTLNVPFKLIEMGEFKRGHYHSDKIDEHVMKLLVEVPMSQKSLGFCFSMNEESISKLAGMGLTPLSHGELFEYPKCCVEWFNENKWKDLEAVYDYVISMMGDYDPQTMADHMFDQVMHFENSETIPTLISRLKKIQLKNNLEVREKFPFVFHQACDHCVDNRDSPTGKLNKIYAEFAEKKYPNLYNLIISESKKEIDGLKSWEITPES